MDFRVWWIEGGSHCFDEVYSCDNIVEAITRTVEKHKIMFSKVVKVEKL